MRWGIELSYPGVISGYHFFLFIAIDVNCVCVCGNLNFLEILKVSY